MGFLEIDGSAGGQVIRTSIGFSAYSQIPVKITNIRASRPNPGLQAQHIEAARAVAELCDAKVNGLEIKSGYLEFSPKEIEEHDLEIKIPTAGSISLVLQALMIPLIKIESPVKIAFQGGATYGKWAPPVDYLLNVLFPLLGKFGYVADGKIIRHGFYPEGMAEAEFAFHPSKLKPIIIAKRGGIKRIAGVSAASIDLENPRVAERQKAEALKIIELSTGEKASIDCVYSNSKSIGSGIQLWLESENSVIGSSAIGERGKKSETVGKEAASHLMGQTGSVDEFAADQLLPFLAIAGGEIATGKITEHIQTNIKTIEKFMPVKFEITGKRIKVTKS
ncbi:MAG: RNA 3'-terminal phosphate cyclase [Candidatus Aenigmarchaeota archaeon]|nr:RNA 3'-terminal phosphate cyclase [Candidatus Aenigmarchaeota archaeon]